MEFTTRGLLPVQRRIKSADVIALRAKAVEYKSEAALRQAELEERKQLAVLRNKRTMEAARESALLEQQRVQSARTQQRERTVQQTLRSLENTNLSITQHRSDKHAAYQQDKARREYARQYQAYLEECRRRQNMNARVQTRIEDEFRRQVVEKRREQRVTQAQLGRLEDLLALKQREKEAIARNEANERRIAAALQRK